MNRPSPPSGRDAAAPSDRPRYMSERQTEAYLLARDLVRRIRRASLATGKGRAR